MKTEPKSYSLNVESDWKALEGFTDDNKAQAMYESALRYEADLNAAIAEMDAFTKHVGAPTFKEACDALIKTNASHMEELQKAFDQVKTLSTALRKIAHTSPTMESGKTFREWAKDIARTAIPNP